MKSRTLTCIAAVTLFAALAIPVPSAAQQQKSEPVLYTVASLGTLSGTFSDAAGVNNRGQAVGGSTLIGDTVVHAFLWNKGVRSDLAPLAVLTALLMRSATLPGSLGSQTSPTRRVIQISVASFSSLPPTSVARFSGKTA
jgi:probable HAF family extracellular repeat protein